MAIPTQTNQFNCSNCGAPQSNCDCQSSVSDIVWDSAITSCMSSMGILPNQSLAVVISEIATAICDLQASQCEFCLPAGTTEDQIVQWNGSTWVLSTLPDPPVIPDAWLLNGNTVVSEKWLGTVDNFALPVRIHNTEVWAWETDGWISRSTNRYSFPYGTTNVTWGDQTGTSITSGTQNTIIGYHAGFGVTSGVANTLMGYLAGQNITTGVSNTVIGNNAGLGFTSAVQNTAIGNASLTGATGDKNAALGYHSGSSITSGVFNTIMGAYAGRNFFSGYGAAASNANIFVGQLAGDGLQAGGDFNIFMGLSGGYNFRTGTRNILIGNAVLLTSYGAGNITQQLPASDSHDVLLFGNLAAATKSNQVVVGSNTHPYEDVQFNFAASNTCGLFFRTSTPEGAQAAQPGSLCSVNNSGTGQLYIKTSGTGNTGWCLVDVTCPS